MSEINVYRTEYLPLYGGSAYVVTTTYREIGSNWVGEYYILVPKNEGTLWKGKAKCSISDLETVNEATNGNWSLGDAIRSHAENRLFTEYYDELGERGSPLYRAVDPKLNPTDQWSLANLRIGGELSGDVFSEIAGDTGDGKLKTLASAMSDLDEVFVERRGG